MGDDLHNAAARPARARPYSSACVRASVLALWPALLLVRLTLLLHPQGDLFGLTGLSQGVCPAKNKLEWLPPRPSTKPGEVFRARAPNSMVWYEHLSKAGGTSFCKLAQKNMKRPEVRWLARSLARWLARSLACSLARSLARSS